MNIDRPWMRITEEFWAWTCYFCTLDRSVEIWSVIVEDGEEGGLGLASLSLSNNDDDNVY